MDPAVIEIRAMIILIVKRIKIPLVLVYSAECSFCKLRRNSEGYTCINLCYVELRFITETKLAMQNLVLLRFKTVLLLIFSCIINLCLKKSNFINILIFLIGTQPSRMCHGLTRAMK